MFALLSPRVWIAVAVVIALAASHWKAYRTGQDAINAEWQADIAARTVQALEASEAARTREKELSAKVGRIDRAYQDQKRATAHVASAVAVGMRELETALTSAPAASACTADTSGIAGTDPRPTIARECARQLSALDAAYGKLADKARALQEVSGVRCVNK